MEFQFPAINYLYALACILALVMTYLTKKQVSDKTSRAWMFVVISFAVWTFGEFVANIGTTLEWQLGFQRLVYLGVISSVVSWIFFAIHFSGNSHWLNRFVLSIMLIVPASTLLLVATLDRHALFYQEAGLAFRNGYYVLDLEYGIAFWVQLMFCSYLYTAGGSLILIASSLKRPSIYRNQNLLIVVAASIPMVANVLYVYGVDFAGGFDPTSIFFVFSAILVTIATRNYFFLRLAPVARDLVFRNINSPVLVVNQLEKVTDVNPAFTDIAKLHVDELIGKPLDHVLEVVFNTKGMFIVEHSYSGRLLSRHGGRHFEISSMPVHDYRDERLGRLIILTDVTQIQRALDEISRLAHTDLLTQLPNRRALIDWVEGLPSIDSMFQPVIICMADLDHFKSLNDTYGHHCGDYILKEVGYLLRETIETSDMVARWGGEEFCLVLTGRTWELGEALVEQLRAKIEGHLFVYEGQDLHVTMTFGMVQRQPNEELDQAIKRADLMMYDGKRRGRNVVFSAATLANVQ